MNAPKISNSKSEEKLPLKEAISVLVIGGMHSAACVRRVELALRALPGVASAGVNLLTRMATVRPTSATKSPQLITAITALGYEATLASPGTDPREAQSLGDSIEAIASRRSRFIAGAILTFFILLVDQFFTGDNKIMWLFLLATPVQI